MSNDPEMHQALLSDALKLLEGGSITAAADALRSAIEIEFRPDIAEIIGRIEDRIKTGGRADDIVADLREAVEEGDFFGSDLIIEDAGGRPSPARRSPVRQDSSNERAALETLKRKLSSAARDSGSESGRGASDREFDDEPTSTRSARYRAAAPPPPAHRRTSSAPRGETSGASAAHSRPPAEDLDEFDFFGQAAPSGQSHLAVEPEHVEVDVESTYPGIRTADHEVVPPLDAPPAPPLAVEGPLSHASFDSGRPGPSDPGASTPTGGSPAVTERDAPSPPATTAATDKLRPVSGGRQLPVTMLIERAKALMSRGDLASASEILDEALYAEPGHGEALDLKDDVNHRLGVLRMSALEPLERTPRADLRSAGAFQGNQRAMYLLTMVDGTLSLQDLIDLSGLSTTEAAALLNALVEQGALRFD